MHFGCAHNLGATSFFKIIQTILALFHFANFAFDIFLRNTAKMRIKNMTIISTIDALLKNGELEEIIENGRIKLRTTHQDI